MNTPEAVSRVCLVLDQNESQHKLASCDLTLQYASSARLIQSFALVQSLDPITLITAETTSLIFRH
jgi:hypothetical protein